MYAGLVQGFISTDPLKDEYPQLNSYNYAGNKPITLIDIFGLGPGPGSKNSVQVRPRTTIAPELLKGLGLDPGGITPKYGKLPVVPTGIRYAQDSYGNIKEQYKPLYRESPFVYSLDQKPLPKEAYNNSEFAVIGMPGVEVTVHSYEAYLKKFQENKNALYLSTSDDPLAKNMRENLQKKVDQRELDYLERLVQNGDSLSDEDLARLAELLGKVKGIFLGKEDVIKFISDQEIKNGDLWKNPTQINAKAKGGASVDNIPETFRLQIQRMSDRWQVSIIVIGSRARGSAGEGSDWDYIVSEVKPGMLHDMRFRLPKSDLSRAEIGRARLEIFDLENTPLNFDQPHIIFTPNSY